jgi:hypothetical protein
MAGIFGPQELCNVIGKERLPNKRAARIALAAFGRRKGSRTVHWCIFCEGYHMTKGVRGKPGRAR